MNSKESNSTRDANRSNFWPNFLLAFFVGAVPLGLKLALNSVLGQSSEAPTATELAPWVLTDKDDYSPGETAYITGGRFLAGETIVLQVLHVHREVNPDTGEITEWVEDPPAADTAGHPTWNAVADDDGR